MPASYLHQSLALDALASWETVNDKISKSALLAGSEGPDPLFFSFITKKGHQSAPEVGHLMHKQNTGDFLRELIQSAGKNPLLQSFVYGFLCHYATDTICHPYIYTKSFDSDGHYNGDMHCKFEHALDVYLYRKQGHSEGLPNHMAGYAGLSKDERRQIANIITFSANTVFPDKRITVDDVMKSFADSVLYCKMLKKEALRKKSLILKIASKTAFAGMIDSHVMPNVPLGELVSADGYSISGFYWSSINNASHSEWRSFWEPDRVRTESFEELYRLALERSLSFMQAAGDYYAGSKKLDEVLEVIGDMSYDSGINWRDTAKP